MSTPHTSSNPSSSSTNQPPTKDPLSATATAAPLAQPWTLDSVLSTLPPPLQPSPTPPSTPIPFLHLLQRLKTTPREGWRRFSIPHPESIADHMYRMSIITMLTPPSLSSRLNIPHCTKMALVHDMAESIVGDITPVDGVGKGEKARREKEAMEYLSRGLLGGWEGGEQGRGLQDIFEEYEEGETLESRFVHDVDKMELLLQMVEYEREMKGEMDLGEFSRVAKKIELEECKVWAREVLREREEFWKALGREAGHLEIGEEI